MVFIAFFLHFFPFLLWKNSSVPDRILFIDQWRKCRHSAFIPSFDNKGFRCIEFCMNLKRCVEDVTNICYMKYENINAYDFNKSSRIKWKLHFDKIIKMHLNVTAFSLKSSLSFVLRCWNHFKAMFSQILKFIFVNNFSKFNPEGIPLSALFVSCHMHIHYDKVVCLFVG